ncbi:hypothetical protein [Mycobacterium sp.]|uniref:hypothetical protein n=1 Tax=Mycobacterium sp. TaxID=1785 RepID=UPI003BAB9CB3
MVSDPPAAVGNPNGYQPLLNRASYHDSEMQKHEGIAANYRRESQELQEQQPRLDAEAREATPQMIKHFETQAGIQRQDALRYDSQAQEFRTEAADHFELAQDLRDEARRESQGLNSTESISRMLDQRADFYDSKAQLIADWASSPNSGSIASLGSEEDAYLREQVQKSRRGSESVISDYRRQASQARRTSLAMRTSEKAQLTAYGTLTNNVRVRELESRAARSDSLGQLAQNRASLYEENAEQARKNARAFDSRAAELRKLRQLADDNREKARLTEARANQADKDAEESRTQAQRYRKFVTHAKDLDSSPPNSWVSTSAPTTGASAPTVSTGDTLVYDYKNIYQHIAELRQSRNQATNLLRQVRARQQNLATDASGTTVDASQAKLTELRSSLEATISTLSQAINKLETAVAEMGSTENGVASEFHSIS